MTTTADARAAALDLADAGRTFAASIAGRVGAWLSSILADAATRALVAAARDSKTDNAVAEVIADAAGVADALAPLMSTTEAQLDATVLDGLTRALVAGWRAGVQEQNRLLPERVRLGGKRVDDAVLAARLASWPIVGHPAAAIAAHHAAAWRFAVGSALGAAVATGDSAGIAGALAEAGKQAAARAEAALAEAFQAGAGAARIAAGEALRRATA